MNKRTSYGVTAGFLALMLFLVASMPGEITTADSTIEGLSITIGGHPADAVRPVHSYLHQPDKDRITQISSNRPCLPVYGDQEYLLRVNDTSTYDYEPYLTAGDLNFDGKEDVLITKVTFQTYETYPLDILLNDGVGGMLLGTTNIFSGTVPIVQNPTRVILEDFNNDQRTDIFVADHGYDADPFPGYQNTLALSTPSGKLVDASDNLPWQYDFSHSACAGDIDDDTDLDLYIANIWAQNEIGPQIQVNNGSGDFSIGENRLPPLTSLNQNGYTTCEFADFNNDTYPDLILGDAGDEIDNEYSTPYSEVLLNNGSGVFSHLANAVPAKRVSAHDISHDIKPIYLDNDAYIDILMLYEGWTGSGTGWQGSYIQVLINNQDGTFRDETASRIQTLDGKVPIRGLELRDMDRDGDLDLLAESDNYLSPSPFLYLNDGSGHFSLENLDFKLGYLYYAFLDLGGTGGHDMIMATSAPPEDIYAIRDVGCPLFLPFIKNAQ